MNYLDIYIMFPFIINGEYVFGCVSFFWDATHFFERISFGIKKGLFHKKSG